MVQEYDESIARATCLARRSRLGTGAPIHSAGRRDAGISLIEIHRRGSP